MNENNSSGGELLPIQSGNAITAVKLTEVDGEPRTKDTDLAKRLGFSRPRDIRSLIERHAEALGAFGGLSRYHAAKVGMGRPDEGFWLTEAQAL